MARRLRLQFPGAIYHIINRGNYRRDLFATDGAAGAFERVLGETCARYGWVVHAFAAMRNHFHLALTTPAPNLEEGMHWLQTTFALRFNRFRSESGHLFQGRYQSPLIENATALARVVAYIHLNPFQAGIVPAHQSARFRWGSLFCYVHGPRPEWLSAGEWLAELGLDDSPTGWGTYVAQLDALAGRLPEEEQQDFSDIARGRPIGTEGWKRALARAYRHRALELDLPQEETLPLKQARWLDALAHVLESRGLTAKDLVPSPRLPRWKVEVAALVRQTSGAPYRWIANQLRHERPASLRAAVCWLGRR